MISKVFDGHSFYHACRYMCNKQGAVVLAVEGVRGHNYKLMADDFISQHELRLTKKQACFHSVLSFYPGENPGDATMVEIARKYLEGLGITNTQYAITKHTDKAHLHLHIMANMVNNEGRSISDSWIGYRGKKQAQQLTQKYKLVQALEKNLELTHLEALSQSEANRYKIYTAIMKALPHCRNIEDLESRLKEQGITIQYKYKGQTQEKQGISFKIGDDCFKGSKVDRKLSLGNLEKILQHQQTLTTEQRQEISGGTKGHTLRRTVSDQQQHGSMEKEIIREVVKGVARILDDLLKPEETYNGLPYELLKEARKKKKKNKIQR